MEADANFKTPAAGTLSPRHVEIEHAHRGQRACRSIEIYGVCMVASWLTVMNSIVSGAMCSTENSLPAPPPRFVLFSLKAERAALIDIQ